MDWKAFTVAAVAFLDFSIATVVYLQNRRDRTLIAYALFGLVVALWGFGVTSFLSSTNERVTDFSARFLYFAGGLIPVCFYYFSLVFNSQEKLKLWQKIVLVVPAIVLFFLYFASDLIISGYSVSEKNIKYFTYGPLRIIFDANLWLFFVLALRELLRCWEKFKNDSVLKIQILYITLGTYLVLLIAGPTNVIAPLLSVFDYIWIGPTATILWVMLVTYAIIKHRLFDMKIIAAEAVTFVFWTLLLVRIFLSETPRDWFLNAALFFVFIVLGIFLIKSSIKESLARERIEKLASELKIANDELRRLDRQKSEFVSIASHQLKSPLTAIKGYSSLLLDGSFGRLAQKSAEPVKRILESSQQLINIIEDFLNIARIEQGRMEYNFSKIDVLPLIKNIAEELAPNLKGKNLKILVENDCGKKHEVMADPGKIRQVFLNVLDNAIKYTPAGKISAKLSCDENNIVRLSVSDTGIGITEELKGDLFKKFSRGSESSKFHANGSGIGLYLGKEIVKAHGGRIWAESDGKNKGSTFVVELPKVS